MHSYSEPDPFVGSNARTDAATAELVERGVEFNKTLGKTVATAYFKENRVPEPVIQRILSTSRARRAAKTGAPAPRH
ncbi:hypothetical protein ACFDR9_003606 [Janthinobacterium sp. CG_23.3]|uniref:hypothetical protein n=1 Tax=unclassified Janthinobacterium TaxID=2610881 RepID=UPI000348B3D5|nr:MULTISPECIES: hypothetical protein [unclassified Janthinobacterium]MEC5161150.1 hypothetical protein [Janthinobacterium sp. CG_S6]